MASGGHPSLSPSPLPSPFPNTPHSHPPVKQHSVFGRPSAVGGRAHARCTLRQRHVQHTRALTQRRGGAMHATCTPRYNQFVPQLMLGRTLCDSSNHPDYSPVWCTLHKWHIGDRSPNPTPPDPDPSRPPASVRAAHPCRSPVAFVCRRLRVSAGDQLRVSCCTRMLSTRHMPHATTGSQYFFGLYGCQNHSDASGCPPQGRAATGELVPVEEGDTVYTRFDRTGAGTPGTGTAPAPALTW